MKKHRILSLLLALILMVTALPYSANAATAIGSAKVTASSLNIRKGPGTKYGVIATVKKNATVTLLQKSSNNWYQVKLGNGKTGYCSGSYLKVTLDSSDSSSSVSSGSSASGVAWSAKTTSKVNLRKGTGTKYKVLTIVPKGAVITVLEKTTASWYKVKYKNTTGYMSKNYLKITGTVTATPVPSATAAPDPTAAPTATPKPATTAAPKPSTAATWSAKTTAAVNLRKGAGTKYKVLAVVPKGAAITVLEKTTASWYKVKYKNTTGYMSKNYIQITTSGTSPSSPSGSSSSSSSSSNTDWNLLLINPWNKIPSDFKVTLATVSGKYGSGKVDSRIKTATQNMLNDCIKAGCNPYLDSAYRTTAKQNALYQDCIRRWMNQGYNRTKATELAGKSVAPPGTSEHQIGLALDIVDRSNQAMADAQAKTKTQKWLMKNCYKYGFILRYPKGKTSITGIIYEPWHYRYVGVEAATEIYNRGITFEEYLQEKGLA